MKLPNTSRLHALRMENDAAGFAMDEKRGRFAALAGRHETGSAPRAVSAYQLFQTPPEIAGRMAAYIPTGARVLEPSAGLGRLLDALAAREPREVVAVEMAPQCAGELYRQNRPGVTILQRDFLDLDPCDFPLFDAVIMNPPFHLRADVRHINRALEFLRPGGVLVALCMDTPHREHALRGISDVWEKLPARSFSGEGTGVDVVLMVAHA